MSANKTNPSNAEALLFLVEVRSRLIYALTALLLVFAVCLYFSSQLYTWLAFPLLKFLPQGHLIATQIVSPFFVPFKLAFMAAMLISVPFFLYQVWAFIAPALYGHERRMVWPFLLLSSLLFYAGMLTVTEKLKPVIVLSHLLTGLSILSVLWWAYVDLHIHDDSFMQRNGNPRIIKWLWLALVIIATQITLGGWVSTHYAGLACIDFPYCNGQVIPNMQWNNLNGDLITIHMLHRIGALVTATYLIILSIGLAFNKSFRRFAILIFAIVGLQVTLGILNVLWLRPVWIALIHHGVAIILLLTIITALIKAHYESRESRYGWIA